jgi:predicted lipoprotein with Yx(FWY)xxD motif
MVIECVWCPRSFAGCRGPLVQRGKLGTVTRDGVTQVTYDGKPLYRLIEDTAANVVNGEDVAAFNGN